MKKTDFDVCLCPPFLILGFFDALYTPIWVALMYVLTPFVTDKENRTKVLEIIMMMIYKN